MDVSFCPLALQAQEPFDVGAMFLPLGSCSGGLGNGSEIPNREPQESSHTPVIFLRRSWGSLFWVPIGVRFVRCKFEASVTRSKMNPLHRDLGDRALAEDWVKLCLQKTGLLHTPNSEPAWHQDLTDSALRVVYQPHLRQGWIDSCCQPRGAAYITLA